MPKTFHSEATLTQKAAAFIAAATVVAGASVVFASPAQAAACAASAASINFSTNTATVRRTSGGAGCQVGVNAVWRPSGSPASAQMTTGWRWSSAATVSVTTQPFISSASSGARNQP